MVRCVFSQDLCRCNCIGALEGVHRKAIHDAMLHPTQMPRYRLNSPVTPAHTCREHFASIYSFDCTLLLHLPARGVRYLMQHQRLGTPLQALAPSAIDP